VQTTTKRWLARRLRLLEPAAPAWPTLAPESADASLSPP
jgi:hypothetical protein